MSDPETPMARRRARIREIPHLAITSATWRHDIGDEIARRAGVPMVTTACGIEETTTLTTRREDRVRCPKCRAAIAATVECSEAGCTVQVPDEPANRCGGAEDGGPQGCGQLFCGPHLFVTYQYGYLCAEDHNNVDDWPAGDEDDE